MLLVARGLTGEDPLDRRWAAPALLLLAVMELAFIAARFRVNQVRGATPWWRLPARGPVVSVAACVVSTCFAVMYLAGWLAVRN